MKNNTTSTVTVKLARYMPIPTHAELISGGSATCFEYMDENASGNMAFGCQIRERLDSLREYVCARNYERNRSAMMISIPVFVHGSLSPRLKSQAPAA